MSARVSNCPNCGAPAHFRWSGAVQTVCEYCRSILVRRDLDLERVGQVADLPADVSPIQIGTEGVYGNRAFVVLGRIVYEYEQGSWNEWHLVFSDGTSGWLSDAQAEYAVSFRVPGAANLPAASEVSAGTLFVWDNVAFRVVTLTTARYRGVEGELPFEYWDKEYIHFADLRSHTMRFGTIDYSESPPLLFLGEFVEFDALRLRNLRHIEGWS